jgi:hypothetical protein
MDDAMRCDRCRQEVTYESVRLGHDRLCEDCVEEIFQGTLTELTNIKDVVGRLEAKMATVRDALEEAVHIVDNHVDGECEECTVAVRKINAALLLFHS